MGNQKLYCRRSRNPALLYCARLSCVKLYRPRRNHRYILGRRPFQGRKRQDGPPRSYNLSSDHSPSQLKRQQEFQVAWGNFRLLCFGIACTRLNLVFECVRNISVFITVEIMFLGMQIRSRFGPVTIVWSSYLICPSSTLQFLVA